MFKRHPVVGVRILILRSWTEVHIACQVIQLPIVVVAQILNRNGMMATLNTWILACSQYNLFLLLNYFDITNIYDSLGKLERITNIVNLEWMRLGGNETSWTIFLDIK